MAPLAKKVLRRVAGVLLVLLGVVGLLMPILPGWIFLIPGAVLLGFDIPKMVSLLRYLQRRFPRFGRVLGAIAGMLHRHHTGEQCKQPDP